MGILHSTYVPPRWFRNAHLQTVYPYYFRRIPELTVSRERLTTPDGDFLDVDRIKADRPRGAAIVSHGLEGSSRSGYARAMAAALVAEGWDALLWNYRGCGGETNLLKRSYHSGATEDLEAVVNHYSTHYEQLFLIGFSLGGNLTLKYLGERGSSTPTSLVGAVAFSAPCDLKSSAETLAHPTRMVYMRAFLKDLEVKLREKARLFPDIELNNFHRIRTFQEYDELYTAPLHGFLGAEDYWARCSAKHYLSEITLPTLLINALDDPFLGPECMPYEEAKDHPYLHLETPRNGGHLGFIRFAKDGLYWSELRALEFLRSCVAEKAQETRQVG